MELYRCDLTLHDYLFFATTERGKVAETGPISRLPGWYAAARL